MKTMVLIPRNRRSASLTTALQRGVSLVELMISVTIGLVILGALVALFVSTSRSNREMERANGLIENGRLAVQLLENDIAHSGFWGTYVPQFDNQTSNAIPGDVPTVVPDPCAAYPADWNAQYITNLIGIPLQVIDGSATCTAVIADQQPNTDVLVVRHAEPCVPGESVPLGMTANCEAAVVGRLYFQSTLCNTDVLPYVLSANPAAMTLKKRTCTSLDPAEQRRFVSSIYYVRDYAVTDGDGVPTLMRSQFDLVGGTLEHQPPVALIEGIQGFQVELGVDNLSKTGVAVNYAVAINWADPDTRQIPTNRGDGMPDGAFVSCAPCTVDQLVNLTAVRLHVLVRSREPTQGYIDNKTYSLGVTTMGPYGDNIKRHVFVTTVRLPNIAGRRALP